MQGLMNTVPEVASTSKAGGDNVALLTVTNMIYKDCAKEFTEKMSNLVRDGFYPVGDMKVLVPQSYGIPFTLIQLLIHRSMYIAK